MYYFYFKKGLKTSYVMEDENKNVVYESKIEKFTLFKPYKFTFNNLKSNKIVDYEVSHRVTKSNGIGNGSHSQFRVVTDSHIKINGENNWEYLKKMGCMYETKFNGLKPNYILYKNDKKIADVKTTGSNVYNDEGILSKLPVNGYYQVECSENDLDIVFMFCFMMARACILEGDN